MPFRWSKQKSVCGISVVKREIAAVFTAAISIFGGPEEDRTPEPFGCEPNALPAELRAHIGHFSIKKVAKNGFLRYSILREKSEKPNEKLEGRIRQVMEVHMNANAALSQLSYRPIFSYFVYFSLICLCSLLFWPGPCYVALALPAELRAQIPPHSSVSYYTIILPVVKTNFFAGQKFFCCQFGNHIVKYIS